MTMQFVPLKENQISSIYAYMDSVIRESAVAAQKGLYEIVIQDQVYKVFVDDVRIEAFKKISVDLLEEMRKVQAGGFEVARYDELTKLSEAMHGSDILALRMIYDELATERMEELEMDYFNLIPVNIMVKMVLIRPVIMSAIVGQYEALIKRVNNLDDDTLYKFVANFLFRAMLVQLGEKIS